MAAAAAAPAPGAPAAQAPSTHASPHVAALSLFDLPDPLLDAIFSQLGLSDLAAASCTSRDFCHLSHRALGAKTLLSAAADLPLLPRAHNLLLMGGGSSSSGTSSASSSSSTSSISSGSSSGSVEGSHAGAAESADTAAAERQRRQNQRRAVLSYLPQALHHARCARCRDRCACCV